MRFITRIRCLAAVLAAALVALLTLGGTAHAGGPSSAQFDCVAENGIDAGSITVTASTAAGKITLRTTWKPWYPIPPQALNTTLKLSAPSGLVVYTSPFNLPYSPGATSGVAVGPLAMTIGTVSVGQALDTLISTASPSYLDWNLRISFTGHGTYLYCLARTPWTPALTYS